MRLITKVLGFVLGKALFSAALLLTLFVGYLLISTLVPTLKQAEADRERLEEVLQEQQAQQHQLDELKSDYQRGRAEAQRKAIGTLRVNTSAELRELDRSVAKQKSTLKRLRHDQQEACGLLGRSVEAVLPGPNPCKTARQAVATADKTLRTLDRNVAKAKRTAAVLEDPRLTNQQKLSQLGESPDRLGDAGLRRQIEAKESQLDQSKAEAESLTDAQESWAGWVVAKWAGSWRWLLGIVVLVLLAPPVLRTLGYFVMMPLVSRSHSPIRLAPEPEHADAGLLTSPAERTMPIPLAPGEVLSARSEYVRPVRGQANSRILYDWSAPFISFAAGLYGLTRVVGDEDDAEATLAAPDDPNSYLMRIDFSDHPGIVMHPRHVVGVIGTPELTTRWRWGVHALATWQVRYIMFAGTGSLIIQGVGDVVATVPGDRSTKIEQHLMMGFDSRLTAGVDRTEVFWPYLWGKTPLVDDRFTGPFPLFWQKSNTGDHTTPIVKAFNTVFSALGKLLGF